MTEEMTAEKAHDIIFIACQRPRIEGYKATEPFRPNESVSNIFALWG